MTKNFFILSVLAIFTVFTSACKKDEDKYACEKSEFLGTFNGSHSLNINQPTKISIPINDKIIVSDITGTDSVLVTSETLGLTVRGIVTDCKIYVPGATVESFEYELGGIFGDAIVENVNANLTLRFNITKGQLETQIDVNEGTASTSTGILNDQSIADTELKGTFK
ncbi:MAG: hypothetical protein IPK18_12765 [Sphingobacteriales bacterium]|nr:MAG: hypothetical protein IPK18_12765 [Sphingobacteriales bacterium]